MRFVQRHQRKPKRPIADRFWAKVDQNGPLPTHAPELGVCYLWLAATSGKMGYGCIWDDARGRMVAAHIVAYEIAEGHAVPDGMEIDHLCRVPLCVRRSHLEAVPHRVNVRRGIRPAQMREKRGEKNHAAKLTQQQVAEILRRYAHGRISEFLLADEFGVSQSAVSFIVRGKTWILTPDTDTSRSVTKEPKALFDHVPHSARRAFQFLRDEAEHVVREVIYRLIDLAFVRDNLYGARWEWQRRLAWWALPYLGGWGMSPRAYDLNDRRKARTCEHRWFYDHGESQGPWTGYIERCIKCNAIQQIPL